MSSRRPPMKATTVRLGTDLLQLLEAEAEHAGVSVAQYVRQASLARAAAASAARGRGPFDLLAAALREVIDGELDPSIQAETERVLAGLTRLTAAETRTDSNALRAQSEQAQAKHRQARHASETLLRRGTG
jgi:predicted DNA-binding protein